MNRKQTVAAVVALSLAVGLFVVFFGQSSNVAVLHPKGIVAQKQLHLMVIATLLMLIVVIPVFALTFGIAWKYRAGNTKARYTPDWDHNRTAETIWWLVPTAIIAVLAVITWQSSHDLDPFKPLASAKKPITVQVVALQWKWLFIYPEQHIASVNLLEFPEDTPVNFQITADAPMNSFWIPQLGGQVYAMAGMSTQLHLMADNPGSYDGRSANLSGNGFAGMTFTAKSTTQADFDTWTKTMQQSPAALTTTEYNNLAKPSQNDGVKRYAAHEGDLYDRIIMKYMMPSSGAQGTVAQ